ncbi:MAG: M48 family metallopeptidase [Bryobacteraceae bacterium]
MKLSYQLTAGAILLAAAVSFAQKPKTIKPGWNLFSQAQDVQLGKEAAGEIEKQVAVVNNAQLVDYVNRIGKKLVAQPEAGQYPYTFKVVYDKSINAFALPGGPSYVHTGLIQAADNEAQIAGVLAHEVSHVALRHGTSQVTKAQAIQLLAGLGGAMAGGGLLGQLAQVGAGLGANSLLLKFSRSAESDADLLGARMMAKAGYDPVEMARFFEKLEAQEQSSGRSIPQFLSDHPNPGNRVKAVQAEVKLMPAREYTKGDTVDLGRMKTTINGLPVPPKANTNFRADSGGVTARPNGQLKQYSAKGLGFKYPANWEVFSNQQSSEITVASRDGIAETNGNAEIAYGAIIGLAQTKSQVNLDNDTKAFLDRMVQQNKNMKASGEATKRFQVNGANALLNVFFGPSAFQGQREVDAIVTVAHPQGLLYMILIAPEGEYPKAQPFFDQMIQSLQF